MIKRNQVYTYIHTCLTKRRKKYHHGYWLLTLILLYDNVRYTTCTVLAYIKHEFQVSRKARIYIISTRPLEVKSTIRRGSIIAEKHTSLSAAVCKECYAILQIQYHIRRYWTETDIQYYFSRRYCRYSTYNTDIVHGRCSK